ncbi:MAG: UDP-2,3-diacylglucosamine diphosphatase LpxI [Verrucomicrobiae bacterium]|nr:UDP-2,3-diacylglucosamine diphosphatase LpxI [Verrucomicrobiae bacterium]
MTQTLDTLGIIAGNRDLPLVLAREARAAGIRRLVAVAFEGETNPALTELVDEVEWVRVGQLGRMLEALTRRGVRQCVMVGQIAPKNLFDLRPDWRAMTLLLRLKEKNAHTLFGAIAQELAKEGVELVEATTWLQSLIPQPGHLAGPALSGAQSADVEFGHRMAREIARLDIGQTVVVKGGTVLAVEGWEGTDACLARGGELAGKEGGAVAVKVAKAHHDFRFDIPCAGPRTVEVCAAHGVAVLAVEAGRSLLLERAEMEALAARRKVSLVAVAPPAR